MFNLLIEKRLFMKKTYKIEVDCANCANKMEEVVNKSKGVKNAVVNFMTQKIIIDFDEGVNVPNLMLDIRDNCRKIYDDCDILL